MLRSVFGVMFTFPAETELDKACRVPPSLLVWTVSIVLAASDAYDTKPNIPLCIVIELNGFVCLYSVQRAARRIGSLCK